MRFYGPVFAFLALLSGFVPGRVAAFTLSIDYSNDAAGMNFFGQRAQAKAALEAAAADISSLLSPTHLGGISPTGTPNVNLISGVNGGTHVNANWDLVYTNPATGLDVILPSPTLAADTVRIYVGFRHLGPSVLASGAPGGADLSLDVSGSSAELAGAVADLEAKSNAYMGRGAGPVISTFNDTVSLGGAPVPFSLKLGAMLGQLSFNNDYDGNNITDTLASLDNLWHYNHNTAVPANKFDFYSVALHELLHGLGFGAADTWSDLVIGPNWLGAHAAALNGGSGAGLISPDGSHITDGYMSTAIETGAAQKVVMDSSQTLGTRRKLTAMDAAMLQDIGYSVAAVPEPGTVLFLFFAGLSGLALHRRR